MASHITDPTDMSDDQQILVASTAPTSDMSTAETAPGCCHPESSMQRFIALILMCLLGFGSYFCYDNPAALESHFKQDLNITVTEYASLYSVYSWPNVVLCFVGGFLIDRVFGIRFGTSLYMSITLVGEIVFASAIFFKAFYIMILGRFIFGIGAESLAVAQNNYAVLWFKGKELNMVFGLQLSFARVGSAVNFMVMGYIYNYVSNYTTGAQCLALTIFLASLTCVISLISSLVLGILDKRMETSSRRLISPTNEVVQLTDVMYFKKPYWYIAAICVFYYVAIFPFISLAEGFLIHKFHLPEQTANYIGSSIYMISGVLSPIFGLLVDKLGRNINWIIGATVITILGHSILASWSMYPLIGMSLIGVGYSGLASSLWPLVALVIPEYQLGTAYGVCQAVQNLGLAIFAILSGVIVDHLGYVALEIFYISSLLVSMLFTILLFIYDFRRNRYLNMTPRQRQEISMSLSTDTLASEENPAVSSSS